MHAEAYNWLSRVVSTRVLPALPGPLAGLELGAVNVNGSGRPLFPNAQFLGVDRVPGRGVDVVCTAPIFDGEGRFDVVLTTETLEHAEQPGDVLESAWCSLRPGGMLLITAAADPRKPHRCDGSEGSLHGEHYANVDPTGLRHLLTRTGFLVLELEHDAQHGDVYALAVKPC